MQTTYSLILVAILFIVGCTPIQYSRPALTVQHKYELSISDVDANPLNGVKIEYTLKDDDRVVKNSSYTTSFDGMLKDALNVTSDSTYQYLDINTYRSEFSYKASKDGYYPKSGTMSSTYQPSNSYSEPVQKDKITLIQPIDYFDKDFVSRITDAKLKIRILDFIDLIILQGLITESVLETHSINLISFKDNSYLQFKFTNANVYNSLKLDKYDIGKRLFDEVIRKVLTPLNEHIGDSKLFYGYDLTIVGYTKSFADKYATSKQIEYRFLIPGKIVSQYKNKEISGQQVLDSSVILMDDERIELKLQ